jgi:putative radical SAM enzyme (TIGR03279 family)
MVTVTDVFPNSRGERAGICAGDILISINDREINDVLDYRFHLANKCVKLLLDRNGKRFAVDIIKKEYDDIGLDFETPLMDKKHSCENKCIFCFIDQLPKGMRKTLYFKDDDSRLSFLHGNYVTLTNLHDKDIDRIIEMHISPVNVSVHTTNPTLRVKMMKNKRSGEVLSYLKKLADAGISLCAQIVLCKGVNDGDELLRSMRDLEKLFPALESVSIVPAGLTKFRDGLYQLESFTPEECAQVIRTVTVFGDECKNKHGSRLFFASDEFYLKAGLPLPDDDFYEGYAQIENGVGMLTDMKTGFEYEMEETEYLHNEFNAPRKVSVATGYAAYEHISSLCEKLCREFDGLDVKVYAIRNDFFGPEITVAGLLTGKDIIAQLSDKKLGDELLIPAACLRAEGDVLLDDISPEDIGKALGGIKVSPCDSEPSAFIRSVLGILI